MRWLVVKKWRDFQHYKNRSPAWIKLHTYLLDDFDFLALPDETKCHLMMLWLLASKYDGKVPDEPSVLRSKMGLHKTPDIDSMVRAGFLVRDESDDSYVAQHATPIKTSKRQNAANIDYPDWLDQLLFKQWIEQRPARARGPASVQAAIEKLDKMRAEGIDPNAVVRESLSNGWQGLFKPDRRGQKQDHRGPGGVAI